MPHSAFQNLSAGRIDRHRHAYGYAALVLSGGYLEAGDRGRFDARPGQVLLHGAWESHMDALTGAGAAVLNLPWTGETLCGIGRVADTDGVARTAERDLMEAAELLRETFEPVNAALNDWPDRLATALRRDPALRLEAWAEIEGLAPATISRGFRQAFATTPKRYRAEQRALQAVRALERRDDPSASLAVELGFADQAHMTRAVRALTGVAPGQIRVKSVQARAASRR